MKKIQLKIQCQNLKNKKIQACMILCLETMHPSSAKVRNPYRLAWWCAQPPPITCSFLYPPWAALWTLPRLHCWETWQTLLFGQDKLSSSFTEIFHYSERVYALPKEFTLGPFRITNSPRKFNIWFNYSKLDLLTFGKYVYSSVSLYVTGVSLKYVQII